MDFGETVANLAYLKLFQFGIIHEMHSALHLSHGMEFSCPLLGVGSLQVSRFAAVSKAMIRESWLARRLMKKKLLSSGSVFQGQNIRCPCTILKSVKNHNSATPPGLLKHPR